MTTPDETRTLAGQLSRHQASALLGEGLGGQRRPIDLVIDRLKAADGGPWFSNVVDGLQGIECQAQGLVCTGSLVDLKKLKDTLKQQATTVGSPSASLEITLGYFLVIAAARERFAESISSRSPQELAVVLADLAVALPEPFDEMPMNASLSFAS